MGFFKKNEKNELEIEENQETLAQKVEMIERPRICCFDIEDNEYKILEKEGFNLYSGSLGNKINVPNSMQRDNHQLLLINDFPRNLHEYDIFILDLTNSQTVEYNVEDHTRNHHIGKAAVSLLSSYPETIFDPRPLSSLILKKELKRIGNRENIIIVFSTGSYEIEYEPIKVTQGGAERQSVKKYNIYSFVDYPPIKETKYGKEIFVCDIRNDLRNLLEKHCEESFYEQTFFHPKRQEGNERVLDENYTPLLKNMSDEIISISEFNENSWIVYLPQIQRKGEFLKSFLTDIAPNVIPNLFPFSTTFSWKNDEKYCLPNQKRIIEEKELIIQEYEQKKLEKDNELNANNNEYAFLHKILTETGDELVDALVIYLSWLGFKNVKKMDEEKDETALFEEDIQIEFDDGLLIIECKGIAGTSTDADCSQISKIKHRRCRERSKFDVYALYIVNHQRFQPPLKRRNPPFSEHQIKDSINDERGLLSTWQLFNLYQEIEDGIITKIPARNDLLGFGLINFKPANIIYIDEPNEIFMNGYVCIVNLKGIELKVGDQIIIEKNNCYKKAVIIELQIDDIPFQKVDEGEVGIKFDVCVKKKSKLWKKQKS